jgi:prolyl-tRNA synthetase
MRLSQYFLPVLKEIPAEAQIQSHRLMLRAGLICQTASGIYSWLPLGQKVLRIIEDIIQKEHDKNNCHRVILPTIQPAHLWQESGRYEDYGKEMLRIKDRHDRDMLYGPTHEEVITDLAKQYIKSYKNFPQILYQIHWKFRDEIRPRFGVMRAREFFMKDAYSFDLNFDDAKATYKKMFNLYLDIFKKLGLSAIPVQADPGAIGGDLSHEFQIIAPTGESALYYDKKFDDIAFEDRNFDTLTNLYAAAEEKHDSATCGVPDQDLKVSRGIEVGHIFYFGKKYSDSMNFTVTGPDGKPMKPEMGSYGIGVSRLVGAIIEANHDDHGIMWPEEVAPFKIVIINAKATDETAVKLCEMLYRKLQECNIDVLYDDTKERAGSKFATADLIGIPWQIIVGQNTLENGIYEIKNRRTDERLHVLLDDIYKRFCA